MNMMNLHTMKSKAIPNRRNSIGIAVLGAAASIALTTSAHAGAMIDASIGLDKNQDQDQNQDRGRGRGEIPWDKSQPAKGYWLGYLTQPNGVEIVTSVYLTPGEDGAWTATTTCVVARAFNLECQDVSVDGHHAEFTIPGSAVKLLFAGDISEDGQSWNGTVDLVLGEQRDEQSGTFTFHRSLRVMDIPRSMAFTGKLDAGQVKLDMSIALAKGPNGAWVGHIDIPGQLLNAYPLTHISQDESGVIKAQMEVIPATVDLELQIGEGGANLHGAFTQGGVDFAIDLPRDANYTYRGLSRPQTPKPPFPYRQVPVEAEHPIDGFKLAGTLTLPDAAQFGPGPYPTAVLISGSGQQDRDETIVGHKPFLVIADHLTRNGIAVMRYDDRGVGGSQVPHIDMVINATSHTNATDALAVVNKLRTIDEVDNSRIGLIGHSEGGLIAPILYSMDSDIAFMVLLAGPGVTGEELLRLQLKIGWKLAGATEQQAEKVAIAYDEAVRRILGGASEQLITEGVNGMADALTSIGLSTDAQRETTTLTLLNLINSPWGRYFLATDPEDFLPAIKCPVLAVNGTLDVQVVDTQNLTEIHRILTEAGTDVTAKHYAKLNHLFQPAITGAGSEYPVIEQTIDQQVLDDMVQWIRSKVMVKR